jgi:hypothetical protein
MQIAPTSPSITLKTLTTISETLLATDGSDVGIGTTNPRATFNIAGGNSICDMRFSFGAGGETPTLGVGNQSGGGKFAALVAGTGGSVFSFDETGYFALQADSHSNYNNNSLGGSTNTPLHITASGALTVPGSLGVTGFTTLAGTTAGNIQWQQYLQGAFKAFAAQALGYENDTATNQTITFPTAFANVPEITKNTTGLTVSATTTTLTITAPNATTLFTGIIKVEWF